MIADLHAHYAFQLVPEARRTMALLGTERALRRIAGLTERYGARDGGLLCSGSALRPLRCYWGVR